MSTENGILRLRRLSLLKSGVSYAGACKRRCDAWVGMPFIILQINEGLGVYVEPQA